MNWADAKEVVSICIAIFGLFIAIQVAFVYFFIKWIDKVVERQQIESQKILSNDFLINAMHDLTSAVLEQQYQQSLVTSWALQRILRNGGAIDNDAVQYMLKSIRESNDSLERSLISFMVISRDETKRQSAIRDISEKSGDGGSLLFMKTLMDNCFPSDASIRLGIERLRDRLRSTKR